MTFQHLATALAMFTTGLILAGIAAPARADDSHKDPFDRCAKACSDCMWECESCARHCADLLEAGQKEHSKTLATCADCAEICAAAAKIVARHGPMATMICESCAKARDLCAGACDKFPQDERNGARRLVRIARALVAT